MQRLRTHHHSCVLSIVMTMIPTDEIRLIDGKANLCKRSERRAAVVRVVVVVVVVQHRPRPRGRKLARARCDRRRLTDSIGPALPTIDGQLFFPQFLRVIQLREKRTERKRRRKKINKNNTVSERTFIEISRCFTRGRALLSPRSQDATAGRSLPRCNDNVRT